jgi:hypothetical protein
MRTSNKTQADIDAAETTAAEEWLDQLDPNDPSVKVYDGGPLRRIAAANEMVDAAESKLREAVRDARDAGFTWGLIGMALGTSRQAVHQRFKEYVTQ